jgi:hypothetical protein
MKLKTKINTIHNFNFICSCFFILVLLNSIQFLHCESFDTGDDDDVGGSLLSLASPKLSSSAASALFTNPAQETLNKMAAINKLINQNGNNIDKCYYRGDKITSELHSK